MVSKGLRFWDNKSFINFYIKKMQSLTEVSFLQCPNPSICVVLVYQNFLSIVHTCMYVAETY